MGEKPAKDEAANDRRGPRAVVAAASASKILPENGVMDEDDLALDISAMRLEHSSPFQGGLLCGCLDQGDSREKRSNIASVFLFFTSTPFLCISNKTLSP